MKEIGYVIVAEAEKSKAVSRAPKELDDSCGFDSATINRKTLAGNSSRKKSRSKTRQTKKSVEKVFPEELLGDACKYYESASSYMSAKELLDHEIVISDIDDMKFSKANVANSEQHLECSSCGLYDVKRSHLHCNLCNDHTSSNCKFEDAISCNGKITEVFNGLSKLQAARSNNVACNDARKTKNQHHNINKKHQSRFTWQRCERGTNAVTERSKLSRPSHVNFGSSSKTSSFSVHHEPFVCDNLLVTPSTSRKQTIAALGTKALHCDKHILCQRICVGVRVESSLNATQQSVYSGFYPYISPVKPKGYTHSMDLCKSNGKPINNRRRRSYSWCTTRNHASKSDTCRHQSVTSQTELLQQFPCEHTYKANDPGTIDVIQPCFWMKLPRAKLIEEDKVCCFVNREWRDVSCIQSNNSCRVPHGQNAPPQQCLKKRIPVCKKNLKIPNDTITLKEDYDNMNNNQISELNSLYFGKMIPPCPIDSISGFQTTSLLSPDEITSLMEQASKIESKLYEVKVHNVQLTKDYHASIHIPNDLQHLFINAQMVERAFVSSYRLQLAAETIQRATGYPIANFERLLCSATPFVGSSVTCNICDGYSHDQPCINPPCGDQIPNISLQAIWKWYEEPTNYGLKVNVVDPPNQKGYPASTISFHSHFVPLLSAVQLFGYRHFPSSSSNNPHKGKEGRLQLPTGMPIINSLLEESNVVSGFDIVNSWTTKKSSNGYLHGGEGPLDVASEANLIFEFFESEQPQRRVPLHNKIVELASGDITNNHVFGDPSKLRCTILHDLHPASWFSVAWYPIYTIPEGKLRAAFLTYHSLGYVVQRCMKIDPLEKNLFGVVLPIIGLQSYNAQGELWFSPNTADGSCFRELTSVILKERLRTLEENALHFARVMVCKDHITMANQQPDYEFFMSRKY